MEKANYRINENAPSTAPKLRQFDHHFGSSESASAVPPQSTTITVPPVQTPAKEADSRASRKLKLLKRSGLFGSNTGGATIERATTFEDLRDAYKLVHDVYIERGYIYSEGSGLRLRIFEADPNTMTFVAKVDGRVVGALSVVGDSEENGLPSDSAFKSEIDALRDQGLRLCEVSNQAILEEYRKTAIATELMRCGMAHTLHAGYDRTLASVSPSHSAFYQMMNFSQFGAERSYSETIYDPVVAMIADLDFFRETSEGIDDVLAFVQNFMGPGNPYLPNVAVSYNEARRNFLNARSLRQLFITESSFLTYCSVEELQILKSMWGNRLYSSVTGRSIWSVTQNWIPALLNVLHIMDDHSYAEPLTSPGH